MDCVQGRHRSVQLKFTEFRYWNWELVQGVGSVDSPARWKVHPRYYSPNGYWRAGASAVWDPRASPFDFLLYRLYVVACT